jgi:hypothetical protein
LHCFLPAPQEHVKYYLLPLRQEALHLIECRKEEHNSCWKTRHEKSSNC